MRAWLRRSVTQAGTFSWEARTNLAKEVIEFGDATTDARALFWQATIALAGGGSTWGTDHNTFLENVISAWTEEAPLTVAAGDPGSALAGLRHSFVEAHDALTLGLRLLGEGHRFLHRDMGIYRLLRYLQGTEELEVFLADTLDALAAYDAAHQTELTRTLELFLEGGGNVSATAKSLHLHRNSLLYRLERIRDISSLDPADPTDAFTLKLALILAPLR
jgi:purine catabolism regulator